MTIGKRYKFQGSVFQVETARATSKKITDVITIVVVTAMPYAAASALDVRKPMTRPMLPTISAQFTSGTYT